MYIGTYGGRNTDKTNLYNFYGINRMRRPNATEFVDMENMATNEYPCAAPRGKRLEITDVGESDILAVIAPDTTTASNIEGVTGIVSDGGTVNFYYNGTRKNGTDESLPSGMDWEIVKYQNNIIMNGCDGTSSVMYRYDIDLDEFTVADGAKICDDLIVGTGEEEDGTPYLITFGVDDDAVKNYTVDGVKINEPFFDKYPEIGYYPNDTPPDNLFAKKLSVGDEVEILGFPGSGNGGYVWGYMPSENKVVSYPTYDMSDNNTIDTDTVMGDDVKDYSIVRAVVKGFELEKHNYTGGYFYYRHKILFDLYNKNGESATFNNLMHDNQPWTTGVTVRRRKPNFSHIGIHNNRIWGTTPNGNYLYAGAADDPFDFTESAIDNMYAARIPIATEGVFTGICEYGSELIAFKDTTITLVYGSEPQSYTAQTIYNCGCIDGRSIQVTPSGVIFLGYNGFFAFTGSVPSCISAKLNTSYTEAVGGFDGNIYYASALRPDGAYELMAYDLRYSTWHRQDDFKAVGMFRFKPWFYIVSGKNIYKTNAEESNELIEWMVESVKMYDYNLNSKAVTEIWIKAEISEGASFRVSTAVDNGDWSAHITFNKPGMDIFRCPVRAVNGYSYRYKIEGKGKVVFYEIELHKDEGGRRYKDRQATEQLAERHNSMLMTY